jgi:hypothetical protein
MVDPYDMYCRVIPPNGKRLENGRAHGRVEGMKGGRTRQRYTANITCGSDVYVCAQFTLPNREIRVTGICSIKSMALDQTLPGYVILRLCHSPDGPTLCP